jgi:hypothetical protein
MIRLSKAVKDFKVRTKQEINGTVYAVNVLYKGINDPVFIEIIDIDFDVQVARFGALTKSNPIPYEEFKRLLNQFVSDNQNLFN